MNITALDEGGKPVDWFFLYKVPKLVKGANSDEATGYEYVYYDATIDKRPSNQRVIDRSPFVLNSNQGALNLTLDSVFDKPGPTIGYILYNDERPGDIPGRDNGSLGHTKGVLAFDTKTKSGYWLLHSWPKYTEPKATADPTPLYGQTYLCLSLDLLTLEKIASQMFDHQQPQTYDCVTADLDQSSPIYQLAHSVNSQAAGNSSVQNLSTAGGMKFKVIAKNRAWNQDFWNGLVGPTLQEDMDVDTWIRGEIAPVSDTDGVHKTFDIKYINLGPLGIHLAWPETHDHAKWGITTHSNWVCVGDINRMISQRKRGGGTIAFQNDALWQGLSKTDLLLAPPGRTRDEARALVHATHYDPNDQHGSSPQPAIHTMAKLGPRPGAQYRGKTMKPIAVPKNHIQLAKVRIKRTKAKGQPKSPKASKKK